MQFTHSHETDSDMAMDHIALLVQIQTCHFWTICLYTHHNTLEQIWQTYWHSATFSVLWYYYLFCDYHITHSNTLQARTRYPDLSHFPWPHSNSPTFPDFPCGLPPQM